jgi:hypothetical protein
MLLPCLPGALPFSGATKTAVENMAPDFEFTGK